MSKAARAVGGVVPSAGAGVNTDAGANAGWDSHKRRLRLLTGPLPALLPAGGSRPERRVFGGRRRLDFVFSDAVGDNQGGAGNGLHIRRRPAGGGFTQDNALRSGLEHGDVGYD